LFRQSPKKIIGISITILFVITLMILDQEKEKINFENEKETLFAIYINGEIVNQLPSKEEGYVFDEEKSFCNNNVKINWSYKLWTANIDFTDYKIQNKKRTYCSLYFRKEEYLFNYTGSEQELIVAKDGYYQIELWGASGGGATTNSSQGGYVSGIIHLVSNNLIYVYVGKSGEVGKKGVGNTVGSGGQATFNGGGAGGTAGGGAQWSVTRYMGGYSGGGATDIRLKNGNWNEFESLKSRIMVAGAGGGNGDVLDTVIPGGNNLGLNGANGKTSSSYLNNGGIGATQTTGYAFGYGQIGNNTGYAEACHGHSGGGGGYYGGFGGIHTGSTCYIIGGGGGSSFISGHTGCNAIKEESTAKNIIHTGQSNHYSGYVFENTKMIDGAGYAWTDRKQNQEAMPNPIGGYYELGIGHIGNGYARVTYLGR